MAIKLNGAPIATNRLNGSNITIESLNGTKVFPMLSWRKVNIGERVSFNGYLNHYYRGMYTTSTPAISGSKPMMAIHTTGQYFAIVSSSSSSWQQIYTSVWPMGSTLPSNPSEGDVFFKTSDGLYRAEAYIPTKTWVYVRQDESRPDVDLPILESSSEYSLWLWELGAEYPAPDYPVGTTACVWDGGTAYVVYQVQEV